MKRLKQRWDIDSNRQLFVIFVVFAITGTTSAKFGEPLTLMAGITESSWLYWPVRILIILPIYQVILLIVGWLFGQFAFFWKFEKKMLRSMGLKFIKV